MLMSLCAIISEAFDVPHKFEVRKLEGFFAAEALLTR